jgi:hypothetical protein
MGRKQCREQPLTSQQELAIWQPAWPTILVQESVMMPGERGAKRVFWQHTPFKEMTSRMVEESE